MIAFITWKISVEPIWLSCLFFERTRLFSGIQFTRHVIQFVLVETIELFGSRGSWEIFSDSSVTLAQLIRARHLREKWSSAGSQLDSNTIQWFLSKTKNSNLYGFEMIDPWARVCKVLFPVTKENKITNHVNVILMQQACSHRSSRPVGSKRQAPALRFRANMLYVPDSKM